MKKIFHFTHNDGDAVGCAVLVMIAAHLQTMEVETKFCSVDKCHEAVKDFLDRIDRGEIEEEIGGVIFTDISIKDEEVVERLEKYSDEYGFELFGCDHHATNDINTRHNWFKVIPKIYVHDEKSPYYEQVIPIAATMLLFNYLTGHGERNRCNLTFDGHISYKPCKMFGDNEKLNNMIEKPWVKQVFQQISDYDVYNFRYYPTEYTYKFYYPEKLPLESEAMIVPEVTKLVGPEMCTDILYDHIVHASSLYMCPDEYTNIYPSEFASFIEVIRQRKEKLKASIDKKLVPISVSMKYPNFEAEYVRNVMMIIYSGPDTNTIADYVYDNVDDIDDIWFIHPENRVLSFRSGKNDLNYGKFAALLGGGGHPQAAGAPDINPRLMLEMLHAVYTSPSYYELKEQGVDMEEYTSRTFLDFDFNKIEDGHETREIEGVVRKFPN